MFQVWLKSDKKNGDITWITALILSAFIAQVTQDSSARNIVKAKVLQKIETGVLCQIHI